MVVYLYSGIPCSHKNQLSAATDNNIDEFPDTSEIRILYLRLNDDDDKMLIITAGTSLHDVGPYHAL